MKLMIGITTLKNTITSQVVRELHKLHREHDYELEIESESAPAEYARNIIVGKFLASACTHLLFIDDDMAPYESAAKILSSTRDITGAIYAMNPADSHAPIVGTGYALITRRVLEDKRMWLAPGPTDIPPVFQVRRSSNGQVLATEDVDFCERAFALGYSIFLDVDAKSGHVKTFDITELVPVL